jgi:predicted peptidase
MAVLSVTPITRVYTYGQKVAAVALEYGATVDPRPLNLGTFEVADTIYNFRFHSMEVLPKLAPRTITHVYTNDAPTVTADRRSVAGRYVIVELDPATLGGETVIISKCPTAQCTVKVNPDLLTQVIQREDVYGLPRPGVDSGEIIARANPDQAMKVSAKPVNLLVDDFIYGSFVSDGMVLPYHYHLPKNYDPAKVYPLMIVLPGHGMGWDGENTGVQLAADIPATAWLQPEVTGSTEDVIVLAAQNQRVGPAAEADLLIKLVDQFSKDFSVDRSRTYASTVSYGSTILWAALAKRPQLFTAGLVTGGLQVSAEQAATIAANDIPIWITHGEHDHLLNVSLGRNSYTALRDAYAGQGRSPQQIEELVRYTEYPDDAFAVPDFHAAFGPTYEDPTILQWLLQQQVTNRSISG